MAPGTFSSAAALTLAAVSPVSAVCAGRCDDEGSDGVVLVAAPASAAPPAASAETVAIAVSVFRDVLGIGGFLLMVCGLQGRSTVKLGGRP